MHNPVIVSKNPFSQRSQIPSWNDDSIATATGMRTRLVSFPLASLQSEAVSPKVYEASPEGTKASRILLKASRSVVVTPQSVPTGLLHSWRPRLVFNAETNSLSKTLSERRDDARLLRQQGRRVPELTAEGSCRPTGTRSDQIPPLLPALVQVPAHVVKPVL